jgi:mono/diheme cytochrome c family protein
MMGLLLACVTDGVFEPVDLDWNRMTIQSKKDAYEQSDLFADGAVMQPLPDGALARAVEAVPAEPTTALLARGQDRFAIQCAACHGILGDGDTPVARAMTLRPPPSLHEPRIRALTADALVSVIDGGYGLMPAYGWRLSPSDRWAIAWYVQALQLSRHADLAALPADVRARARGALP